MRSLPLAITVAVHLLISPASAADTEGDGLLNSTSEFIQNNEVTAGIIFLGVVALAQEGASKKKGGKFAAIQAMDRNKNGYLEPDEIPDQHRDNLTRWAKSKGLDPNKPLKLESLFSKTPKEKTSKEQKEAVRAAKKAEKERSKNKTDEATAKNNPKAFGGNRNQDKAEPNAKGDEEKKKADRGKRAVGPGVIEAFYGE